MARTSPVIRAIRISEVTLRVLDAGEGPPVLWVHGFPLNHTMWLPQIEDLFPVGRMIAPDLRGFGKSEATPGIVTMERFADDLNELLNVLGIVEPVTLCGLSMGGYVAWQFYKKYAPRLSGLVLCDTLAAADSSEAAQARLAMAERVVAEGPSVAADAMLPRLFGRQTQESRPDLVDQVRDMIMLANPQGIAAAQRGMAERIDATSLLPTIFKPTLVVVGSDDVISTPAEMRAIAETIPGAEFLEIPDAGHMAPLENPAAVNDALRRFLRV